MTELKDFMYELGRYAEQMHVLKDRYENLTEAEKKLVMEEAPEDLSSPQERFVQVFRWMEELQERLGIENEE
ncbi:hypothetical protein JOC34_001116 [Virgibacillus halotolerans]|uniref:hypothetical protein n=1 Tax=Virgibacillus halotolerans TaxID=1071053 RepID=UPI0019615CBF|nr:hypothetical protein [Virgibacillus halotolerans]MBM7598759.1 hypothetical protein [Virgibacillus halotolerans]